MTGVMCDVSARMKGKVPKSEKDSGTEGETEGTGSKNVETRGQCT